MPPRGTSNRLGEWKSLGKTNKWIYIVQHICSWKCICLTRMIAIALFFCCAGELFVMFASAGIRCCSVPKWSFLLAASELWWGQLYLDEFELSWDGNDLRFNPYESQRIYPATDLPIIGATVAWILPFVGKIRLKWSFWIKFRKGNEKKKSRTSMSTNLKSKSHYVEQI